MTGNQPKTTLDVTTTPLSMVSDFHLDLLFQQESKDTTMAQHESTSDEIAETTTMLLKGDA